MRINSVIERSPFSPYFTPESLERLESLKFVFSSLLVQVFPTITPIIRDGRRAELFISRKKYVIHPKIWPLRL